MAKLYYRFIAVLMRYNPGLTRKLVHTGFKWVSALRAIQHWIGGYQRNSEQTTEVMGLCFASPAGIAAGFDRHGQIGRKLGHLGFGHIEIGTLTRHAEPGHNWGITTLKSLVEEPRHQQTAQLGINIGINRNTPPDKAANDLRFCLARAWPLADYIAINLCNPAAAPLLACHNRQLLQALLVVLKEGQQMLSDQTGRFVPLAVKIELDINNPQQPAVIERLRQLKFEAIIATIDAGKPATPAKVARWQNRVQQQQACEQIRRLHTALRGELPIIAVGGISSAEDVESRLAAGAALVQIHNGLLYQGPSLLRHLHGSWQSGR
ncbi:MAG: hypothetical protein V7731_19415 [Amphritea sp.]